MTREHTGELGPTEYMRYVGGGGGGGGGVMYRSSLSTPDTPKLVHMTFFERPTFVN